MSNQQLQSKNEEGGQVELNKPVTTRTTEMIGTEEYPIRQDKEVTIIRGEGDNFGEFTKTETKSVGDSGP